MLPLPAGRLALVPPARVRGSVAIVAALSICLTAGIVGIAGAALTAVVVAVGCLWALRAGLVRQWLAQADARRLLAAREHGRRRLLRDASRVRQQAYLELRGLVASVERSDALAAQRFDLQALLDQFVQLSAGHERGVESLRASSGGSLSATFTSSAASAASSYGIAARRLRHRLECITRLDHIAGELDATDELIRLVAQRSACASLLPSVDSEIDRRLIELDAIDDAMDHLSTCLRPT